jgi:hypothetical protein
LAIEVYFLPAESGSVILLFGRAHKFPSLSFAAPLSSGRLRAGACVLEFMIFIDLQLPLSNLIVFQRSISVQVLR